MSRKQVGIIVFYTLLGILLYLSYTPVVGLMQLSNDDVLLIESKDNGSALVTKSEDIELKETRNQRINLLKIKADTIRTSALELGGLSEPKIFNYEGNWCIEHQDLSEEDQKYARNQREKWFKEEEVKKLLIENNKMINADMLNYVDMNIKTLKQHAKNDDIVALRMLAMKVNKEVDNTTVYRAAKRLVELGEFGEGTRVLVVRYLFDAESKIDVNPDEAKKIAIKALSYAELGFQHASISGLYLIQDMLSSNPKLHALIAGIQDGAVSEHVQQLRQQITSKRLAEGLNGLDEIDTPRIAYSYFQSSLVMLRERFEQLNMLLDDESLFPKHWKVQYLDTPCIKRLIANREAHFHTIPEIQQQIASLQSELTAQP
ncbi:hypothetical protein [Pseudoalteromonas sp. MMG005]|uniref:hypothetical protein n=1 Tax=Pseudoalteromonas sp. MMG005 TaxID=2822682 RepID=UPI001B39D9C2|nr:hypothetical protein [Pseudoalteromonas sp. MMG005]MBQ4844769.1 hypothetical protein [Pseudoalteromonas sp. MMG005]